MGRGGPLSPRRGIQAAERAKQSATARTAATKEGHLKFRRFLLAASVAALAIASFGVGGAGAGLVGCSFPALSQPFTAWGDYANYYLSPGGGFEGAGWKLGGGAYATAGNESYYVNSAFDSHSLALPPGASGLSPYSCITATDLKVRMFVRSANSSPVRVDVVVPGVLGLLKVVASYDVATTPTWQPTEEIVNLANVLSLTDLSSANIAVRVVSTGFSSAQVDDVYIDPNWWD